MLPTNTNLAWQLAMTVKKQKKYFAYSAIAPFMTKDNLAILVHHKIFERLLRTIIHKLAVDDHVYLWNDILSAKTIVPNELRALVFADCCSHLMQTNNTKISDTSPEWLVDVHPLRKHYCWQRKLGYVALKCLDLHEATTYSETLNDVIAKDMIPQFMLLLPMESPQVTPGLIALILKNGSLGIFSTLLDYHDILTFQMSFEEMLFYAASHLDDKIGMAAINLLEEKQPGIVSSTVDALGNDLLWYSMHNYRIPWFMDECAMVQLLQHLGCNPLRENHLGLSFKLICEHLPMKTKQQKIAGVYNSSMKMESYCTIQKLYGNYIQDAVNKLKVPECHCQPTTV